MAVLSTSEVDVDVALIGCPAHEEQGYIAVGAALLGADISARPKRSVISLRSCKVYSELFRSTPAAQVYLIICNACDEAARQATC